MKKIVSCLLCAVMMLPLVAGCNNVSKTGSDEETVVDVWTGNGHDKAFLAEKITEWNNTVGKENGVRINYEVKEGNYSQKIEMAFQNGTAPDLFSGAKLSQMAENGDIAPIDELPGGAELIERFSDYLMEGRHQFKGKTYSIPKTATTYGIIYNKDMFKAAGLVDENGEAKPPKTLDEMREYAKILTNESKREYGIIFPAKFAAWYSDDVMKVASASCGFVDGYNPATGMYDFSAQAPVMKMIMGIKEDGSYYPGAESLDNDPARARFAEGGVAMKTAASYDYGVLTDQFPAKIDWAVAPLPTANEEEKYYNYMNNGSYLYVNKHSLGEIDNEKLMLVYNFFYSEDLIVDAYKNGIDIPVEWDLVKDIELPENLSQWKQFAEIVSISHALPNARSVSVEGEKTIAEIWLNDIWTGKIAGNDIDVRLKEYSDMMNNAAKKYEAEHPEYDPSSSIIPEWNGERK